MDVSTAAPGPALPIGIAVAVGVLALAVAAALVLTRRRTARASSSAPEPAPPGVYPDDDLLSFREHPPGSPGAGPTPAGARARADAAPAPGQDPLRALTVMILVALVLVTAVAVVAALSRHAPASPEPARSAPTAPGGVAARVAFGGVVLEERAVGITVTYPRLRVTTAGDGTTLARVRLPTWNCMTDRPPDDPEAAGCRASVPEYADLRTPALLLARTDGQLRLHGRFPTYTRSNGAGPVVTGRAYELDITLEAGRRLPGGWRAASGELVLDGDRTTAVDDDAVSVLRSDG